MRLGFGTCESSGTIFLFFVFPLLSTFGSRRVLCLIVRSLFLLVFRSLSNIAADEGEVHVLSKSIAIQAFVSGCST